MLEYTCSFLLLLQDEPYEVTERTLESIVKFRDYAYKSNTEYADILCVCSNAQDTELPKLRLYASQKNIRLNTQLDRNLPYENLELPVPEVYDLFNKGAKRCTGECIFLIEPGKVIEKNKMDILVSAIEATGKDHYLLVVSHEPGKTSLPVSGIFNNIPLMTRGIGRTASNGYTINYNRSFLGKKIYKRGIDQKGDMIYHVSWLIGAIAFEFQDDKNNTASTGIKRLHLTDAEWVG